MKKWIDIGKKLPPMDTSVEIKYNERVSHAELFKNKKGIVMWNVSDTSLNESKYLYYNIEFEQKEVHFWREEEIFEPIGNRFEILDL